MPSTLGSFIYGYYFLVQFTHRNRFQRLQQGTSLNIRRPPSFDNRGAAAGRVSAVRCLDTTEQLGFKPLHGPPRTEQQVFEPARARLVSIASHLESGICQKRAEAENTI